MIKTKYEKTADEELLKLLDSDSEAYSELVSRYLPSIRRVAGIYRTSPEDRDDLVSEGILGLMSAAKSYCPEKGASFSTYACVCANRRMLNALKKAQRIRGREGSIDELQPSGDASPEKIAIDRETIREILSEVSTSFSDLEREVLNLYLLGESYVSISSKLGIDRKAVGNALTRVRTKLRLKFR